MIGQQEIDKYSCLSLGREKDKYPCFSLGHKQTKTIITIMESHFISLKGEYKLKKLIKDKESKSRKYDKTFVCLPSIGHLIC